MNEFTYSGIFELSQLEEEINDSLITIGLLSVEFLNSDVIIKFKIDISAAEKLILDNIISNHIPEEVDDQTISVKLSSQSTFEETGFDVPYVYSTSKPINHYVCFQGADDSVSEIGKGNKVIFHLTSKMDKLVKDFTFNEDVYIKDGYMISRDAPFGSSVDIELVHPVHNIVIRSFGVNIPIVGTGWFPMNTEDRALLPTGIIVRITVRNSNGGSVSEEQSPSDFWVSGRFELYRKDHLYTG